MAKVFQNKIYFLIILSSVAILFSLFFIVVKPHKITNETPPAPSPIINPAVETYTEKGCVIGGCNKEVCQNENAEPIITACVYRPEFDCYKNAKCEIQNDGDCGWTKDDELTSCLEENKNISTFQPTSVE